VTGKRGHQARWDAVVRTRIRFLGVLVPLLLLLPAARAFNLQVQQQEALARRAERQSQMVERIAPKRGAIIDANGQPLAVSVPVPSVYAEREKVKDKRAAARNLSRVLGISSGTLYERLAKGSGFVWLCRMVEPEAARKVREMGIEGVGLRMESRRYYPNKELAGSVLGFVGTDKGLEGLENSLEEFLRGGDGLRVFNLDARGARMTPVSSWEKAPETGATVQLTLDRNIQFFVEQSLREGCSAIGASAGAAVILESRTGRILAMANYPGFNPNDFGRFDRQFYQNKAIHYVYEPGSTFKVVTIAAALEEKVFDDMDILFCENGQFRVADALINDHVPHGWLTLSGIISKSSNIGATKVGLELGKETLGKYTRAFGFGRETGVLLPGEARGILREAKGWTRVDLANIAFGQGLGVTPLQMVNAVNTIATGGERLRPFLVERIMSPSGEVMMHNRPMVQGRVVSRETARTVAKMMVAVTRSGGSGENAAIPGYDVAGKTGTAQKFENSLGQYSKEKYIASFAGFVPASDPLITAIVVVDEPRKKIYGGTVAAPIWKDMVVKTLKYLNVSPAPSGQEKVPVPPATEPRIARVDGMTKISTTKGEVMPDLRGLTLREALGRLAETDIRVKVKGTGVVVDQVPMPGAGMGGPVSLSLQPRGES